MTFREIDEKMLALVDEETGEILDEEAFQNLAMDKEAKVENMALWVLDLKDEAEQIEAEIKRLQDRKKAAIRKAESLKNYLQTILVGQKMRTPFVSVSFRNNESVDISDEDSVIEWAQFNNHDQEVLKYQKPEISKTALKKIIQGGAYVPGAALTMKMSTVIK